jgi:hypothetical protein
MSRLRLDSPFCPECCARWPCPSSQIRCGASQRIPSHIHSEAARRSIIRSLDPPALAATDRIVRLRTFVSSSSCPSASA